FELQFVRVFVCITRYFDATAAGAAPTSESKTMETKPDDSGLPVSGVGKIGSAVDGKHIYFELIFPSGHRDRFNISSSDMDAVVLGLQAAVVEAAQKFSGQSEVSSLRGAQPGMLTNFALGVATGPGLPPMVALRLKHKSGLQNNVLMPPEAAESLGKQLIDMAGDARAQQPPRKN